MDTAASQAQRGLPSAHPKAKVNNLPQWSWLRLIAGLQQILVLAWFLFVCLVPQNVYMLVALVLLIPLWGLGVLLGGWHLFKGTGERALALKAMLVFPAAYLALIPLRSLFGLPVLSGASASWLAIAAVAAYPLYGLAKWLLRATAATPQAVRRITATDLLILGFTLTLLCQLLFLVIVLTSTEPSDSIFGAFGSNWYKPTLNATAALACLTALVGVPYALIGLVRRTRHAVMMLAILGSIGLLGLVGVGFFVVLAAAAVG